MTNTIDTPLTPSTPPRNAANTTALPLSKAPTHAAYQVRDRQGGKSFWTRIGSAWAHADGNGFNIQIEAVPLDGRITLRVASERKD